MKMRVQQNVCVSPVSTGRSEKDKCLFFTFRWALGLQDYWIYDQMIRTDTIRIHFNFWRLFSRRDQKFLITETVSEKSRTSSVVTSGPRTSPSGIIDDRDCLDWFYP